MKHDFKILDPDDSPYISFIDPNLNPSILSSFLNGEIDSYTQNSDWFLEGFDNVLSGKSDYEERDGEFYGLVIRKDITEISNLIEDQPVFEIETSTLRDLVEAIANARKK